MSHRRPPRLPRTIRVGLVALPLILFAGCVHSATNVTEVSLRYEFWVPIVVFLGGALAVPVGWISRQRSARFGWSFMILGAVAAIGFAPSLALEQFVVADDHFQVRTGIWGVTSTYNVKYADMESVRITSEVSTGRRGRKSTSYYFVCQLKGGSTAKVPMNNKIAEEAIIPLLAQLAGHKIPITNETEGAGG